MTQLSPGLRLRCCPKLPRCLWYCCPTEAEGETDPWPWPLMPSLSSRYDEGSGGSGDEGRDEAHKREWNLFYQKQMRLRKGKDPKTEEFIPPDEGCLLREASSRKIPRLTVKAREHCLGLLEEALSSNHQASGSTDGASLQAEAVELEHEMFQSAKMANVYKASVLRKVAEIHKASKGGQLYDLAGGAKSCRAKAEPQEPTECDIPPTSHVYSFKAKRVGAGFPRGSCTFQTATELLGQSQAQKQAPEPVREDGQAPLGHPADLQDEARSEPLPAHTGEASGGSTHCGGPSPEKRRKSSSKSSAVAKAWVNKKQQLLSAAAHKDSQNITRFLCQKAESPPLLASVPRAEDASPSREGVQEPTAESQKRAEKEEGTQGRLTAPLQAEEYLREGPSTCSPRDPEPPEHQSSLLKETQAGKRPRPQQENAEGRTQKRPCLSAKPCVLAEVKDGALASAHSTTNAVTQDFCQRSAPRISLKEAADVVVRHLTPFYKEGRFTSKELFKGFARHLSHLLTQKACPGKSVKEAAQSLIEQFFHDHIRCESEADWHNLCGPQR